MLRNMDQDNKPKQEPRDKEEEIKRLLSIALTPEAYTRLMNVRIANPEFFQQAASVVLQIFSRYGRKVDEQSLIDILRKLKERSDSNKGGNIIIRRK